MSKLKAIRMLSWCLITIVLLAGMWIAAPQLVSVDIHKVSLVTLGAWLGYWIDRGLFPYGRPDRVSDYEQKNAAMLRRAIVVAAIVIAVSLGA